MLSAKALVNFTLLAIIVPRIIRSSMSSTPIHSSEVCLNILGAETSMLVSVVGVLCVALASKFWMMLTGKAPPFGTSGIDESSAYHLRLGLSSTRFHHVASEVASYRVGAL
jgi:hypothetical protein